MSSTRANCSLHWATEFIGKPWEAGAEGPNSYDCWGLVRFICRSRYRIDLPQYSFDHGNALLAAKAINAGIEAVRESEHWSRVDYATEGDIVVLGSNTRFHHVGIWIEPDLVLHATHPTVTAQTLLQLKVRGMANYRFYNYSDGNNH